MFKKKLNLVDATHTGDELELEYEVAGGAARVELKKEGVHRGLLLYHPLPEGSRVILCVPVVAAPLDPSEDGDDDE